MIPCLCHFLHHVNSFGIDKGFLPHVGGALHKSVGGGLLDIVLIGYGGGFVEGNGRGCEMLFEHIYILRHSYHNVYKACSIRTEVLEDVLQGVHVSLLTHLGEDKHHSIYGASCLIEIIDSAGLYR